MKNNYRNIFIVDNKSQFDTIELKYNSQNDLVLTYDFALKKQINDIGGDAEYIDHMIDAHELQKNNYIIYEFFKNWHYDKEGHDIFTFKDVPFGFSFRQEFWNDFVSYVRLYLSVKYILKLEYKNLHVKSNDNSIIQILKELKVDFNSLKKDESNKNQYGYYFPISQWINSKIKPSGMRKFLYKTREKISYYFAVVMPHVDKLFKQKNQHTIFIQDYHPTKKLIQELRNDKNLTILLENFSRHSNKLENLKERLIPMSGNTKDYISYEIELLEKFKKLKYHQLILTNGDNISEQINEVIVQRLKGRISHYLRALDSCIKYLDNNKVDLVVLIANMGHVATLFDLVCKHKKIPSYMIINGMLLKNYQDEAKYATNINSYSQSIKENYFKGMENIVTLGDPRMDMYSKLDANSINRKYPTITIGTSGFNPTDLNSYVAVEFDFIYDILKSFTLLQSKGEKFKIIIKVRPNGYLQQYKDFANDYFKDLDMEYLSTTPMIEVLKKTDFYITIYSQTLFEASCLGIPVVYYKKDTEITNAPFDNHSELVTVSTTEDMMKAFLDFKENHPRYNNFLDRKVMEKYIGYLDGNNFERNKNFINTLLEKREIQ